MGHGEGCGQDAEVSAQQYDCNSAFANWVKAWSEGKKGWCCSHGVKSCPADAAAAGAGYGAGTQNGRDYNGATVAPFTVIPHATAQAMAATRWASRRFPAGLWPEIARL